MKHFCARRLLKAFSDTDPGLRYDEFFVTVFDAMHSTFVLLRLTLRT